MLQLSQFLLALKVSRTMPTRSLLFGIVFSSFDIALLTSSAAILCHTGRQCAIARPCGVIAPIPHDAGVQSQPGRCGWLHMICRYCGHKAGWFTDVHQECLNKEKVRQANEKARRDMERLRREAEEEAQWQSLLPKFYEIAERKIFIDEYGVENWDGVLKEMKKVLLRIAERNEESPSTIASIKNLFLRGAPVTGIPFSYVSRYSQMESGFRQHHDQPQGTRQRFQTLMRNLGRSLKLISQEC